MVQSTLLWSVSSSEMLDDRLTCTEMYVQPTWLVELETPWKRKLRFLLQTKSLYFAIHSWGYAVNNLHFSHSVKVRKNSHSLSLAGLLPSAVLHGKQSLFSRLRGDRVVVVVRKWKTLTLLSKHFTNSKPTYLVVTRLLSYPQSFAISVSSEPMAVHGRSVNTIQHIRPWCFTMN